MERILLLEELTSGEAPIDIAVLCTWWVGCQPFETVIYSDIVRLWIDSLCA